MGEGPTRVALFCSGGFSTSLAAAKVQKYFEQTNRNMTISAYGYADLNDKAPSADVIVLAPQIRYVYDDVVKEYPDKKVVKLTMQEFGSMDGAIIAGRLAKEGVE